MSSKKRTPWFLVVGVSGLLVAAVFAVESQVPGVRSAPAGTVPAYSSDDEADVRAVARAYLDGLLDGDVRTLQSAFEPDARFEGSVGGTLVEMSFEDWAESRRGKRMRPVEDYRHSIEGVLIAGDAAVVRTDIDWPDTYFVDYLSLLRIDGEWKIVNKTWTQWPSPRAMSRIEIRRVPAEQLAAFTGTYVVEGGESLELPVNIAGDGLSLGVRGKRYELYFLGGDTFAPAFDVDARIRFERSDAGQVTGMRIAMEDATVVAVRKDEVVGPEDIGRNE